MWKKQVFSYLEVTLGFFATFQTITRLAFRVIFVGQPLMERVTVVLHFLYFYTVCLTVDLWSPTL